ncbi:hypothetical protein H7H37_26305 [Mycolicibacterium insubricum]|nr:hypothetical protein [Mycolicibacterium insubricum]
MAEQEFAVWAPRPERVRVEVDGVAHPMRRDEDNWWRATVEAGDGSRYGFLLDDDPTVAAGSAVAAPARRRARRLGAVAATGFRVVRRGSAERSRSAGGAEGKPGSPA